RAHHIYRSRGEGSEGASTTSGLDFRDAHRDAHRQRSRVLPERNHRQGKIWERRKNELRSAAHFPGVDHFGGVHRAYLFDLVADYSRNRRRQHAVVETGDDYFLRHTRRRGHSRTGKSFYFHRITSRQRSRHFRGRGRRIAGNFVRLRRGKFFRLLPGNGHGGADGGRIPDHRLWTRQ